MRRCAASVAMASELASTPPTISPKDHYLLHRAHNCSVLDPDRGLDPHSMGSLDPDPDQEQCFGPES